MPAFVMNLGGKDGKFKATDDHLRVIMPYCLHFLVLIAG